MSEHQGTPSVLYSCNHQVQGWIDGNSVRVEGVCSACSSAQANACREALAQAQNWLESVLAGEEDAEDQAQDFIEATRVQHFGGQLLDGAPK